MLVPLATEGPTLPMDLVGYGILIASIAVTLAWLWYLYR